MKALRAFRNAITSYCGRSQRIAPSVVMLSASLKRFKSLPLARKSKRTVGEFSLSSTSKRSDSNFCLTLLQVRSYFTLSWRRSPAPFDEMRILRDLHGPLRARILKHIGARARVEIPIMQVLTTMWCIVNKGPSTTSTGSCPATREGSRVLGACLTTWLTRAAESC